MTNFDILMDFVRNIKTKEQLAMLILQIIQQGKKYQLENIEMVNYWLNNNADEIESEV